MSAQVINRQLVQCKCKICSHVWHGFTLPLPIEAFVEITKHIHCPMCASDASQIVLLSGHHQDQR